MSTLDIIQILSADCKPVKRITTMSRTTGAIIVSCVAFAAVSLMFMGTRDLSTVLYPRFWIGEIVILLATLFSGAGALSLLRVPGGEQSRPWRWVILGCIAWLAYLVAGIGTIGLPAGAASVWSTEGSGCALAVGVLCIAPALSFVWLSRRGYPTELAWTSIVSLITAGVVAVLGIELYCRHESALHHLVFHAGPVLLLALAGAPLVGYLLRRAR